MSTQRTPALTKHSEQPSRLRGVAVFQSGRHRGKTYSERDLSDMVRNFDRSSAPTAGRQPSLRVPAVLGHEESQEFLERSDLPAAAWCERLYRDGKTLRADFGDVHPKIMKLLRGKAYRTVSAEVYDEPPEGLQGSGKMLRRVAFLGGEIPQIKNLKTSPCRRNTPRHGPVLSSCRGCTATRSLMVLSPRSPRCNPCPAKR